MLNFTIALFSIDLANQFFIIEQRKSKAIVDSRLRPRQRAGSSLLLVGVDAVVRLLYYYLATTLEYIGHSIWKHNFMDKTEST